MKKTNKPFLAWKVVDCREGILRSALYPFTSGKAVNYVVERFVSAKRGENPALFCFEKREHAQEFVEGFPGYKIFRCTCKGKIERPTIYGDPPPGTVTARYVKLLKEVRR